jgi:hypothetical protein
MSAMKSVQLLSPHDRGWLQYIAHVDHDFFHRPAYHDLSASNDGGEAWLAVYGDTDKFVAWPYLLQPIAGFDSCAGDATDVTSVYGYAGPLAHNCASDESFLSRAWDALLDIWRSQGGVSLFTRFHPVLGNDKWVRLNTQSDPGQAQGGSYAQGRIVTVNLTPPEVEIWNDYKPKLRRALRRCQREGLASTVDPSWTNLEDFVRLYYRTMERNHAASFYFFTREYFRTLQESLGPYGSLIVTRQGDDVVATALLIEYRGIVNVHLLANDEHCSTLGPSKRLLVLGGGRGSRDDDSLFRFKALFSRMTFPFSTGRWILDPPAYELLIQEWKKRSRVTPHEELLTGHFPLYRAPFRDCELLPNHEVIQAGSQRQKSNF